MSTRLSPTLQGALKDDFEEAVVAYDMPEPCKFQSLDSCQKRFLWTHKDVDLVPRPAVRLALQAGDAEKFPQTLGFESPNPFCRVSQQDSCFQPYRRLEVTRGLYNLSLLAKLMMPHCQILFNLVIAAFAEALLLWISAERCHPCTELVQGT